MGWGDWASLGAQLLGGGLNAYGASRQDNNRDAYTDAFTQAYNSGELTGRSESSSVGQSFNKKLLAQALKEQVGYLQKAEALHTPYAQFMQQALPGQIENYKKQQGMISLLGEHINSPAFLASLNQSMPAVNVKIPMPGEKK